MPMASLHYAEVDHHIGTLLSKGVTVIKEDLVIFSFCCVVWNNCKANLAICSCCVEPSFTERQCQAVSFMLEKDLRPNI